MLSFTRFATVALVAMIGVVLAAGCARGPEKRRLVADPKFSLNVIRVPHYWPREKLDWPSNATEAESHKEAWARYGTPDFIRNVYTFDRRIVQQSELREGYVLTGQRSRPLIQWIYLDKDLVLEFDGPRVEELELDDPLRTVCIYGDPNEIRRFPKQFYTQTSFYYYNHGMEFVFTDDVLTNQRSLGGAIRGATELR